MVFLAINLGCHEGWALEEFPTSKEALNAVKNGKTWGNEWKILKELVVTVASDEED